MAASIARAVAFDPTGRWRTLLVDDDGHLVHASSENYRPPAPMARFVKLRDKTCQWWGCQRPAVYCEEDHTIRWLDSRDTSPGNLRCLCVRHHHMKHETGWTYRAEPDGTITWTSPSKNVYRRPPPEPPPF